MLQKIFTGKRIKNFLQWVLAAFIAFCVANLLILPYWQAPGWIYRNSGATSAIYHSGTTLVNGYEGYGTSQVDDHGYLNPDLPLADSYILALGCSHTKAIEVPAAKRYTSILNEALSQGDFSKLYVYNLAIDGFYYTDIVKGFDAALAEFPGSDSIIIEIPSTDLDLTGLTDSLNSRPFDAAMTGETLYTSQSTKDKLKIAVKEYLPLLSLYLSKQFVNGGAEKTPFFYTPATNVTAGYGVSKEAYLLALEPTMAHLREVYDKEIIIYYHPFVTINEDGTMSVDDTVTAQWFAQCCEKYDITFINAGNTFLEKYQNQAIVPYGFSNTSLGTGHLNKEGHRISASLLYDALTGEDL
ncbi:MAG: hypothetical protein IJ282_04490 [Lachnospiraceae bacterium]|nr:hypothetical protein [Lachnospiraceae bacterium]